MSIMYNRIASLCAQHGITPCKLCSELGISRSTVTDLKAGRKKDLRATTAWKIANYFGVSVHYLLGGEDNKEASIVSDKRYILDNADVAFYSEFKDLTDEDKAIIRNMVTLMRKHRATLKNK